MSKLVVQAATDPRGWRAGTARVLGNALLVLLAYEVVFLAVGVAQIIVTGWTPPLPPVELAPLAAAFYLVRWIFLLPGLLPVLVGLEYIARRVPHARVVTAVVAFAPMVVWELTKTPGDFPSVTGAALGVTALLFAVLARLPAGFQGSWTEDRGAPELPVGAAVAPR